MTAKSTKRSQGTIVPKTWTVADRTESGSSGSIGGGRDPPKRITTALCRASISPIEATTLVSGGW